MICIAHTESRDECICCVGVGMWWLRLNVRPIGLGGDTHAVKLLVVLFFRFWLAI